MDALRSQPAAVRDVRRQVPVRRMPFGAQVALLTWRALLVNLRVPAAIVPPLIIGVFFLLVNNAQLGGVADLLLGGQSYLNFILPLSVISAALSGAGVAGQTIVSDIERGYFDKLMLTPVNRWALLLGPMIAGGIVLVLQTITMLLVGLALGARPETGGLGLLAVLGFALLLGISFSGLPVGVALLTGSAAATGGASFLFFPLTFLTAAYVPLDRLEGWFRTATELNPITYPLEAMRAI
ncbi:MAG TPA: ABC transporter permease, partial [Herpetosiphonaceae bacterium]|nr:ABC transporter permease [Herpetosiphonaceae bacterium]